MSYNVKNLIREIETRGYCQLPGLYSSEEAARMLDLSKEWYEKSKDALTDRLPSLAKNDPFVWNLQNKDYRFLDFIFRPKEVRQILMRFINDSWFKQIPQDEPNYILRGVLARIPRGRIGGSGQEVGGEPADDDQHTGNEMNLGVF